MADGVVAGNWRLRSAMRGRDMTYGDVASAIGVDPKTVERWVTQNRLPHSGHRFRTAELLEVAETYLWPDLLDKGAAVGTSAAELVELWPSRESVPGDVWRSLIDRANSRIEILVYSGGFLVESYGVEEAIRRVSESGGTVRLLLGDDTSPAVAQRGVDEGLPALPHRVRSTREYLAGVLDLPGVEARLHDTPLYVSIYRFDDMLMINSHTHGAPAKHSPVMRLQPVPGGLLVPYYEDAFERVWSSSL